MCGIVGAAWTDPDRSLPEPDLARMVARLTHRGPDDEGTYRDAHAALGFRRLSILDVRGAHQPLSNEDGTVWTVFNGEIYNFPALRHRLEAKGHTLRSAGDTEVLPHLYEDVGAGLFALLRGMFALAIWDSNKRRLILGRDRLGQKPLLYRVERGRIAFASELKALLALPEADLPRRVSPIALDRYLTYGYVPHPDTILEGVHKLPPGHCAIWEDGKLTLERYWEPTWDRESPASFPEHVEQLRELLPGAVAEQMASDVPLGAFLSGGIDSTVIVGLMQRATGVPVKTFSISFDDPAFDESAYARLAAQHLGTEHHELTLRPRAWETIPALARQFDEPFADSSALPTWHVSEMTKAEVTVALTGDAGDELFAGYDRYRALALTDRMERWPPALRKALAGPLARLIPASSRAKTRGRAIRRFLEAAADPLVPRYLRWCRIYSEPERTSLYSDDWLDALAESAARRPEDADPLAALERAFAPATRRDPVTRAMIADLLLYLPGDLLHKVDMASMAHGLECRAPFLDHRVVEFAVALPYRHKRRRPDGAKAVLKRAFPELLPKAIRRRRKMGFGVPIDRWFRGELRDELRSVLLDEQALGRGIFRPESVRRMIDEHAAGTQDHAYRLWALLMLELWFREYGAIAAPAASPPASLAAREA